MKKIRLLGYDIPHRLKKLQEGTGAKIFYDKDEETFTFQKGYQLLEVEDYNYICIREDGYLYTEKHIPEVVETCSSIDNFWNDREDYKTQELRHLDINDKVYCFEKYLASCYNKLKMMDSSEWKKYDFIDRLEKIVRSMDKFKGKMYLPKGSDLFSFLYMTTNKIEKVEILKRMGL